MRKPGKYEISRRRRKAVIRAHMAFAVSRTATGAPDSLTVFVGRRSLRVPLTPWLARALVHALSPEGQSK